MALIKGTTKSGIKFQLDSKIKDDARLLFLMKMTQRYDLEDKESMVKASDALMDILILIFGTDENVIAFMNEVALKHKGVCDAKHMIAELNDMLDAVNGKNS